MSPTDLHPVGAELLHAPGAAAPGAVAARAREARTIARREAAASASLKRICQLAMTRATGRTYQHVLEVLEQVTRPLDHGEPRATGVT